MALAGIVTGAAANDMSADEVRREGDRRSMSWRTVANGFLRSRRRSARRESEAGQIYQDWHHPWIFFLGVSIMLMSVADAFLTLQLINRGAIEANPFMRSLLWNTGLFVGLKLLMTAFSIFVLVYASRYKIFGRMRVGLLITGFFCMYLTLITYEILGFAILS